MKTTQQDNAAAPARRGLAVIALSALAALMLPAATLAQSAPGLSPNATVVAGGFDNPRGLKFGPDGLLYVAEAGQGGTASSTLGLCPQAAPPGPYTNGPTARISRVVAGGMRETVVAGMPSGLSANGDVMGVSDIAFVGNTLYTLLAGGGCSHGQTPWPAGVLRLQANGTMAVESNHGVLLRVSAQGTVSRVVDISDQAGHRVPTAIAFSPQGQAHVAGLGRWPFRPEEGVIWRVEPSGELTRVVHGLVGLLGIAFDAQGRLYALEVGRAQNKVPIPGTGRVVRINAGSSGSGSAQIQEIASGLMLPTTLIAGPDGALYVANNGFGFPPGAGEVVRITIAN